MNSGQIIIIILIIILVIWCLYPYFVEPFNANVTEFVPVGYPRHGLRGDLLRTSDISNNFIRPDRHIRLHQSNGEMWESNNSPIDENISNCNMVKCPDNDGYDDLDTCWKCGAKNPILTKIPYIHPHVPN